MTDQIQKNIDAFMAAGAAGLEGYEPGGAEWAMPTPESFAAAGRLMAEGDRMIADRRMQNDAATLRVLADAMDADLALSPVVIATGPGVGSQTLLKGMSKALGLEFVDIRCGAIQPHELVPVSDAPEGQTVHAMYELTDLVTTGNPLLAMFDEAVAFGTAVPVALLRQVADQAKAPVMAVLVVRIEQVDEALAAITEATGIHRALVPVVQLAFDPRNGMPTQRVRVVGSLTTTGSRQGVRYLEIASSEMPQTTSFTLHTSKNQDDDDLIDALAPLLSVSVQVAATLTLVEGELVCTTDDITAL